MTDLRDAARRIADAVAAKVDDGSSPDGSGRYRATVTRWKGEGDFEVDVHGEDFELD